MQEKHLYEYAVVRYVPRVEREEFVNIGLIMMCKRKRWLRIAIEPDYTRINTLGSAHTEAEISTQIAGLKKVADGCQDGGIIASLDADERFRWLSAVRSACIQTSRPHTGLTYDLDSTFERLMTELVK